MRSAISNKRSNCLNLIRLFAAIQVMYGHAVVHLDVAMPEWIGRALSVFPGVPIFFMLSGYLIWHSVGNSSNFGEYIKKRFWRIYPELWVGVAIEIVVMLLLYEESVPIADWIVFTFTQGTFLQFWTPDSLRLYGCGTPNGSLWTICVIIQFYFVVWWLYKFFHKKNVIWWSFAFIISIMSGKIFDVLGECVPTILSKLMEQTVVPYLWLFVFGAIVAEYESKILEFLRKYWVVILLSSMLMSITNIDINVGRYKVIVSLLLFAAWLGFAYRYPMLNIKVDISYSIYIYHMTVINAMIQCGYMYKPMYALFAIVLSCIVSLISTITVGKFAKKNKRMLVNR